MNDLSIRLSGRIGRITLARPRALNALSHPMVLAIETALDAWRDDRGVALVLIDAEGERAFCAGGDIGAIYHAARAGDFTSGRRFWADEYRMIAKIARYAKPIVVLAQGLVLGDGVGLSGYASHRILGARTRVAVPECPIGLIPDVGASLLLAQAPGRLGEYLGLSAYRMEPGDAIAAGFFDSHVPEQDWPRLIEELERSGDPASIADFTTPPPAPVLAAQADRIDDAFSAPDLASLMVRLEATDWGHAALRVLAKHSPLSMACTLALVRAARAEGGVEAALTREYRFTYRAASEGELLEGIRAAIIDKDRAPVWRDALDQVRPGEVEAMLAPLGLAELRFA